MSIAIRRTVNGLIGLSIQAALTEIMATRRLSQPLTPIVEEWREASSPTKIEEASSEESDSDKESEGDGENVGSVRPPLSDTPIVGAFDVEVDNHRDTEIPVDMSIAIGRAINGIIALAVDNMLLEVTSVAESLGAVPREAESESRRGNVACSEEESVERAQLVDAAAESADESLLPGSFASGVSSWAADDVDVPPKSPVTERGSKLLPTTDASGEDELADTGEEEQLVSVQMSLAIARAVDAITATAVEAVVRQSIALGSVPVLTVKDGGNDIDTAEAPSPFEASEDLQTTTSDASAQLIGVSKTDERDAKEVSAHNEDNACDYDADWDVDAQEKDLQVEDQDLDANQPSATDDVSEEIEADLKPTASDAEHEYDDYEHASDFEETPGEVLDAKQSEKPLERTATEDKTAEDDEDYDEDTDFETADADQSRSESDVYMESTIADETAPTIFPAEFAHHDSYTDHDDYNIDFDDDDQHEVKHPQHFEERDQDKDSKLGEHDESRGDEADAVTYADAEFESAAEVEEAGDAAVAVAVAAAATAASDDVPAAMDEVEPVADSESESVAVEAETGVAVESEQVAEAGDATLAAHDEAAASPSAEADSAEVESAEPAVAAIESEVESEVESEAAMAEEAADAASVAAEVSAAAEAETDVAAADSTDASPVDVVDAEAGDADASAKSVEADEADAATYADAEFESAAEVEEAGDAAVAVAVAAAATAASDDVPAAMDEVEPVADSESESVAVEAETGVAVESEQVAEAGDATLAAHDEAAASPSAEADSAEVESAEPAVAAIESEVESE
ncbi:hypothetical protein Gpo141_00010086, partial [Globisporangium polare]